MICSHISFPVYSGLRCLMMPYIQGEPTSVPDCYQSYFDIISNVFLKRGDVGYLTIDESPVLAGSPQRGARAKYGRAIHTEAGKRPYGMYGWGGSGWGSSDAVTLERNVEILLANNIDNTCAIWDAVHENTSFDGDIGDYADEYPYSKATMVLAGEVHRIGILTPHESVPVKNSTNRQFLRIVGNGVYGREPYFTINPLMD